MLRVDLDVLRVLLRPELLLGFSLTAALRD